MQVSRWSVAGVLTVALVLLVAPFAPADQWLTVTPADTAGVKEVAPESVPSLTLADRGRGGFEVSLEIEGFLLRSQKSEAGLFQWLTLPDAPVAGEVGTPGIPVYRRLFVAPQGAKVSASVRTGQAYVADADVLGMPVRLAPVQPPVEKIPGARENAPFIFDEAAYKANMDYAPERVTLSEVGVARGQRLFLLEIWPLSYNPATEQVTYWTDLVVDVEMVGGQAGREDVSPPAGLKGVVLNPSMVPSHVSRDSNNYLVVVAQAYEAGIASFASAKQGQGFNVSTYVVPPGTSSTTIKNYIQGLWGGPSAPAYILLVGDTDTIPAWVGSGTGSPGHGSELRLR